MNLELPGTWFAFQSMHQTRSPYLWLKGMTYSVLTQFAGFRTIANDLNSSYTSVEAQGIHRVAEPTVALFKAFGAGLLASPPATHALPPAASFQRAGLSAPPPGAVIVLTTFGYLPGKTSFALEGWKALVAHAEEKEPGALAVDVTEDVTGNKVHTVQIFDGVDSADAHVNGEAIKANREHNGDVRTGERKIVRVKIAYGYLAK
jgi:quinol monooxygenase YgiN